MIVNNYKFLSTFTLKPIKKKKIVKTIIPKLLYCLCVKTNNTYSAHINTKGIDNYKDITVLGFSNKSFDNKNKLDVFVNQNGKYTRIIRDSFQSYINPGNEEVFSPLCENRVYSGYIIKEDNSLKFDIHEYKGLYNNCKDLLNKNNS